MVLGREEATIQGSPFLRGEGYGDEEPRRLIGGTVTWALLPFARDAFSIAFHKPPVECSSRDRKRWP